MLVSKQLVYLELPKTASSHIRDLLKVMVGGEIVGKHNRVRFNDIEHTKLIVGSIRNPWDWYVSLWAFGCEGKGVLYKRLTSRKLKGNGLIGNVAQDAKVSWIDYLLTIINNIGKPIKEYQDLYSDSRDPQKFRAWLKIILGDYAAVKYSFGDGYAFSPINSYAGLYTYYYLRLFSRNLSSIYSENLSDKEKLEIFDRNNNALSDVIRVENLEKDIISILKKLEYDLDESKLEIIRTFKPAWHTNKSNKPDSSAKVNSSKRVKSLEYYYDRETISLVAEKEKLIIQKYGYNAPEIKLKSSLAS